MKTKIRWRKGMSIFLVFTLILEALLVPVFAEGDYVDTMNPETMEQEEQNEDMSVTPDDSEVVGEVEDFREENVKHFRMDDGTYLAVDYGVPVHFSDSQGIWQNIDNTLERSEEGYISENGVMKKIFSPSLTEGKLFEISYQDYAVKMSLLEEKPVDKTQTDELTDAENDNLVENSVSFSPVIKQVQAEVDNPSLETGQNKESTDPEEAVALKEQISSIRYSNVLPETDLEYTNYGYDLKESILIREPQESYTYSFLMELPDLTPVLQKDGSVQLKNEKGIAIFDIPAPYMEDANGVISEQASYDLISSDEGLVLTVTADSDWMNTEERAFPVCLDPSLVLHNNGSVKTTMLRKNAPNGTSPRFSDLFCGLVDNATYGDCEIVFQVESMPTIPANCVMVNADVKMAHVSFYNSAFQTATTGSLTIQAQKLLGTSSNVTGLTWNGVHATGGLGVDSTILDHQTVSSSTVGKYVTWDVTSAALDWMNSGSAKGAVLLTPYDHATQYRFANLIGHAWYENSPYFTVQYRNVVGLEDYYTYQEESVGDAGDLAINDFTQKLDLEHEDVSLDLEPDSVDLSHFYNSCQTNVFFSSNSTEGIHTCDFSTMKLGQGWKLSAQQTIVELQVGKDPYLVYTDGDGTEHYFWKDGNTYKDEDGLNLTITKNVNGGNTIFTMTDTDAENTWIFHNGYLISEQDDHGNMVYYAYNTPYSTSGSAWKPQSGQANRIVQIVQHTNAAGNAAPYLVVADLTYDTNNYLTKITDYAGRETTYTYSSDKLTGITHPDGTVMTYQYRSSTGAMKVIYDGECGYGVELTYYSDGTNQGSRHTLYEVKEFYASSVNDTRHYGEQYHMYRNSSQLTSIRYYGADHIRDTEDDLVVYNAFDYYGRTITSYTTDWQKDALLGVTAGAYKTNSKTETDANNRLSKAASSGQHVENLLLDSGMEYDLIGSGWTKETSSTDPANANAVVGTTYLFEQGNYPGHVFPHTGDYQLKTYLGGNTNAGSGYSSLKQNISLTAGVTYTFSAYVNTSTLRELDTTHPERGSYLAVLKSNGSVLKKSDIISYYTEQTLEGGWERISVTVTPTLTGTYALAVCQSGVLGITAFDDVQLEIGDTMSCVNLLQDGSFDRSSGNTYWSARTVVSSPSGSDVLPHGNVLKLTGVPTSDVRVSQTVKLSKDSDTTFLLSGWGKAESVFFTAKDETTTYDRFFGLRAVITYEDESTESHDVPFSPMYTGWQYTSGIVAPKKDNVQVRSIQVSCAYDKNANDAFFDQISFIEEPAETYTYDSKGNPVAATTKKAKTAMEYFEGTSKLKSYTSPSGTTSHLTYHAGTNDVETETFGGVTTTTSYNTSGSETQEVTRNGSTGIFLKETSNYDASENHQISSVDEDGIPEQKTYNTTTHLKKSQKNGTGLTQGFSYQTANERMSQTWIDGYDSLSYGYNGGRMNTLSRKSFSTVGGNTPFWQKYTLAYDSFGNNTSVSVSKSTNGSSWSTEKKLAGYTYESNVNNGRLQAMTYANGQTVNYSYDRFDRLTEEAYSGSNTYHYMYDAEGNLAKQTSTNQNNNTTEAYTYDYDSLGRLIHSKEVDGSGQLVQRTEHLYDTSDRLTEQNWLLPDGMTGSQLYDYSENDDTLITLDNHVKIGNLNFEPTVAYTYNSLRQLTRKTTDNLFYRAYAYKSGSETDQITSQVEYMNYRKTDGSLLKGYKYTYDGDGNLAAVFASLGSGGSSSQADQTYTYDELGQLSHVNDYKAGVNYSYSYDTAGNLLQMVNLPYVGNGVTKKLTYEDSVWKDRLTKVKVGNTEESITYETPASGYISGNPIDYYNGTHYDFTWKQGRQLASSVANGTTTTYDYDMSGVRSRKQVGNTEYKYDTLSGLVTRQTWGDKTLYFVYDDNSMPYALIYKNGTAAPEVYYYILNLQGDVLGLMNQNAQIQATYYYDPWGAVTTYTASGSVDNSTTSIGAINPLRYRSYYYDVETGFYYLQTRYYGPQIGRFINADNYASTGQGFFGFNMFAYCINNPINNADMTGHSFFGVLKNKLNKIKKRIVKPIIKKSIKIISKIHKNTIGRIIKKKNKIKKRHFERNIYNTGIPKRKEDVPGNWKSSETRGGPPAKCHQFSSPDRSNIKFVSPDGHKEAIYDKYGDLVTDPRDVGTYNYCPSNQGGLKGIIGHFVYDMIPWYYWGNSEDDTTTKIDRIFMRKVRVC